MLHLLAAVCLPRVHVCSHVPKLAYALSVDCIRSHVRTVLICTHTFGFLVRVSACYNVHTVGAFIHVAVSACLCVCMQKSGTRCVDSLNRWPFQHTRLSAKALASPKTQSHKYTLLLRNMITTLMQANCYQTNCIMHHFWNIRHSWRMEMCHWGGTFTQACCNAIYDIGCVFNVCWNLCVKVHDLLGCHYHQWIPCNKDKPELN